VRATVDSAPGGRGSRHEGTACRQTIRWSWPGNRFALNRQDGDTRFERHNCERHNSERPRTTRSRRDSSASRSPERGALSCAMRAAGRPSQADRFAPTWLTKPEGPATPSRCMAAIPPANGCSAAARYARLGQRGLADRAMGSGLRPAPERPGSGLRQPARQTPTLVGPGSAPAQRLSPRSARNFATSRSCQSDTGFRRP